MDPRPAAPGWFDWLSFSVDTLAAAATIAAVVVAAILGLQEVRKFRAEEKARQVEREATDERQRRAQAEQVVGWVAVEPVAYAQGHGPYYVTAEVLNHSPLPIYGLQWHAHGVEWPNRPVPEGAFTLHYTGFLPPAEKKHIHLPPQESRSVEGPLELWFRDSAGRWWHRDWEGGLTELERDPWPDPPGMRGGPVEPLPHQLLDRDDDGAPAT
jgi:hypothetical protein